MLGEQKVRITPGLLVKPLGLRRGAEDSLQGNIEQLAAGCRLMVYPLDKSFLRC